MSGVGDQPGNVPALACVGAPREKNFDGCRTENGICELEGCDNPVVPKRHGGTPKRFCCERCQRIAERRRYRQRHTERTVCKRRGCGVVFDRSTATKRVQLYCTPECMALARSVEYAGRPDIIATLRQYREAA